MSIARINEIIESKEQKAVNNADILSTITPEQLADAEQRLKAITSEPISDTEFFRERMKEAAKAGDLATIKLLHNHVSAEIASGWIRNCWRSKKHSYLHIAIFHGQLKAALLLLQLKKQASLASKSKPPRQGRGNIVLTACDEVLNISLADLIECHVIRHHHLFPILVSELIAHWCEQGNPKWTLFPSLWHQRVFEKDRSIEYMAPNDLSYFNSKLPYDVVQKYTPLHYACAFGDIDVVKKILNLHYEFRIDFDLKLALKTAVTHNQLPIVKLLFEIYKRNPNEFLYDLNDEDDENNRRENTQNLTLLHFASSSEMTSYLLENGMIPTKDNFENNALMVTRKNHLFLPHDFVKKAELLHSQGLQINDRNRNDYHKYGQTLLYLLCKQNKDNYSQEENLIMKEMKQWLVAQNADVNLVCTNKNDNYMWHNCTPLHQAAANNNWDDVVLLLAHNAHTNILASMQTYPLGEAVYSSAYEITKLLLRCGANINERNKDGNNCVFLARNKEMLQILMEHKADFKEPQDPKKSALCFWLEKHPANSSNALYTHYFKNRQELDRYLKNVEINSNSLAQHETRKFILILFHHFLEHISVPSKIMRARTTEQGNHYFTSFRNGYEGEATIKFDEPYYNDLLLAIHFDLKDKPQMADTHYGNFLAKLPAGEEKYFMTRFIGDMYLARLYHAGFPIEKFGTVVRNKTPDYKSIEKNLRQAMPYLKNSQPHQLIELALTIEKMDTLTTQERNTLNQLRRRNNAANEIKELESSLKQHKQDPSKLISAKEKLHALKQLKSLDFLERRKLEALEKQHSQSAALHHLFPDILKNLLTAELTADDHLKFAHLYHDHAPLLNLNPLDVLPIALKHISKAIEKQIVKLKQELRSEEKIDTAVKLIATEKLKRMSGDKSEILSEQKNNQTPEQNAEIERLHSAEKRLQITRSKLTLLDSIQDLKPQVESLDIEDTKEISPENIDSLGDPLLKEAYHLKNVFNSFLKNELEIKAKNSKDSPSEEIFNTRTIRRHA